MRFPYLVIVNVRETMGDVTTSSFCRDAISSGKISHLAFSRGKLIWNVKTWSKKSEYFRMV